MVSFDGAAVADKPAVNVRCKTHGALAVGDYGHEVYGDVHYYWCKLELKNTPLSGQWLAIAKANFAPVTRDA